MLLFATLHRLRSVLCTVLPMHGPNARSGVIHSLILCIHHIMLSLPAARCIKMHIGGYIDSHGG